MDPDHYPKESRFVLDCSIDEAVSALEIFWAGQETLEPLKLQKDDGPQGQTTYRVMETVGGIASPRVILRFVHRWQDNRTSLIQKIYPPSGHTDGLFFAPRGRYPAFLEVQLVEELDRFRGLCPSAAAEPEPIRGSVDKTEPAGPQAPKGKRGKRSRYSQEERDELVMAWEKLDKEETAQTLNDFLCDKLGFRNNTSFEPIIARSTFYGWRRDFYERNPTWKPNKP
jgi:hypothetical protein